MKKTISIVLAALLLTGAGVVQAQESAAVRTDAAAVRAVQELMEAQKMRANLQAMFAQMALKMDEVVGTLAGQAVQAQTRLSDSQRQQLRTAMGPVMVQLSATMKATFTDPALVDEMIVGSTPLYLKHFSLAEIEQMTAFYRSPVGVKLTEATPVLMQEMGPVSERIIAPRMLRMQQQVEQQLEQLKKTLHSTPPSPAVAD